MTFLRFGLTVFLLVFTTDTAPLSPEAQAATTSIALDEALNEVEAPLPELEIEPVPADGAGTRTSRLNRKPGILHAPIYDDQANAAEPNGLIIDEIDHQAEEPSEE